MDFACTINNVTLLADVAGAIVLDIWKDAYANFPPVVGDKITASDADGLDDRNRCP